MTDRYYSWFLLSHLLKEHFMQPSLLRRLVALAPALLMVTPMAIASTQIEKSNSRQLPSDKYEQPQFELVERVGNIEIRRYRPMLVAEVSVDGEREKAINQGFRILAGYIFGGNQGKQSIAMTSPVTQEIVPEKIAMTSPVTQTADSVDGQRWTVAFMMPSKYSMESLPKPNNDRIRFRMSEPQLRAAIRFDGISSASNLGKHREALLAFAAERKLLTQGEPIVAFYDDPFTLPWNRRNEWWIAIGELPVKAAHVAN
jgi:hypothetical protein